MINDTNNFQVKMPEYYLLNMALKGDIKWISNSFISKQCT